MNLRKLGSLLIFSILASSCESDDLETIAEIDNPVVILDPITENIPSTDPNTEENSNNEMTVGAQNWVAVMQANNGLLESTEQSDFVSLYDNSLAILFYTSI